MKRILIITFSLTLILLSNMNLHAQSGMRYPEFSTRLNKFFSPILLEDLEEHLPQSDNYTIWSWDVGDFSGDGFNDVAFTLRPAGKSKVAVVYMFINMDGYLTKVAAVDFTYVELPLEVGIVIRDNKCSVTKKNKKYDWLIRSYNFDNGTLMISDEFSTKRIETLTKEKRIDYKNLHNTEKYFTTRGEKVLFEADYMTIPSYSRNRKIYKGYHSDAAMVYVNYVYKGAFWWKGEEDASYSVSSAYDSQYLYMTVNVNDDEVVTASGERKASDYLEIWFDINPLRSKSDRFLIQEGRSLSFRNSADRGIFAFKIHPGNFMNEEAYLKGISTTDDLYSFQQQAMKKIKAVSNITETGYIIKFKIPFIAFGYDGPPIKDNKTAVFGCTLILHDIDNEFRPEEGTCMSTSDFNSSDPSSYGSLMLIPEGLWYGKTSNIYRDDIIKQLNENGF